MKRLSIVRWMLLGMLLGMLLAPAASAAPYALPDEYLFVGGTVAQAGTASTAGAMTAATPAPTATAAVSAAPAAEEKRFPRHGYFYVAYALVWGGLAAYVAYLASRLAGVEARLSRRD